MTSVELAQVVGGWSGVAAAIAVFGGGFLALRQLRAAAKASRLEATIAARQFVSSEPVQKARRFVMRELTDNFDPYNLSPEIIDNIENVTLSFQYAGHLLWLGLISKEDIIPDVGLAAIMHWKKLRPWINYIRKGRPNQRIHFEYLAGEAERFIRSHPDKFLAAIPTYEPTDEDIASLQEFLQQRNTQRTPAKFKSSVPLARITEQRVRALFRWLLCS